MTDITISLSDFKSKITAMPAAKQEFAASLAAQWNRLSDKQKFWVNKLAALADGEPDRKKDAIGDLTGVMALFDRAKQHLKFPAMVIAYREPSGPLHEVKLRIAGEQARFPGTVNVTDENREWLGRILPSGEFERSPRMTVPESVVALLRDFAQRPAEMASEHGKLTGKCCFCNRPLTDPNSTDVGYGATCADNWGLPWGGAPKAKKTPLTVTA